MQNHAEILNGIENEFEKIATAMENADRALAGR
jgi:uncharacterized protein YukE